MSFINKSINEVSDLWEMAKNPPYEAIDADLKRVDLFLNKAGLIPGVSLVTGQVRESLGYLQIVIGLALACFHQAGAKFTSDEEAKARLYKQAEIDFSYCTNGIGNVFRGNVEKAPLWAVTSMLYSKLILLAYDVVGLRLNYGHEKASPRDIPLLRLFTEQRV